MEEPMKELTVVSAIIIKDNKILGIKRGFGSCGDNWIFPGGRTEEFLPKKEGLIKVFKDKYLADISIDFNHSPLKYNFQMSWFLGHFSFYIATLNDDTFEITEDKEKRWFTKEEALSATWCKSNREALIWALNLLD